MRVWTFVLAIAALVATAIALQASMGAGRPYDLLGSGVGTSTVVDRMKLDVGESATLFKDGSFRVVATCIDEGAGVVTAAYGVRALEDNTLVFSTDDGNETDTRLDKADGLYRWSSYEASSDAPLYYAYDGAGNWSFSAAYAAAHADAAFVTRLRNLREAERFIKAGIPLVASVKFGPGELSGAPISTTNGHLMVVVGFTDSGDVVVNDPAAPDNRSVVRTYDRGEFENAWIPKSGGLVYVVRNHDTPLPKTRTQNW